MMCIGCMYLVMFRWVFYGGYLVRIGCVLTNTHSIPAIKHSTKLYQIYISNTHTIPAIKHPTKPYQVDTSNTHQIPAIKHSTKHYQIHTSNTYHKTRNKTLPNIYMQYPHNTPLKHSPKFTKSTHPSIGYVYLLRFR
jgi:hypothetical protein